MEALLHKALYLELALKMVSEADQLYAKAQQLDEAAARYKYEIFLPRQKLLLTLAKKHYSLRVQQVLSLIIHIVIPGTDFHNS